MPADGAPPNPLGAIGQFRRATSIEGSRQSRLGLRPRGCPPVSCYRRLPSHPSDGAPAWSVPSRDVRRRAFRGDDPAREFELPVLGCQF